MLKCTILFNQVKHFFPPLELFNSTNIQEEAVIGFCLVIDSCGIFLKYLILLNDAVMSDIFQEGILLVHNDNQLKLPV